jgi:hypothetical protein
VERWHRDCWTAIAGRSLSRKKSPVILGIEEAMIDSKHHSPETAGAWLLRCALRPSQAVASDDSALQCGIVAA